MLSFAKPMCRVHSIGSGHVCQWHRVFPLGTWDSHLWWGTDWASSRPQLPHIYIETQIILCPRYPSCGQCIETYMHITCYKAPDCLKLPGFIWWYLELDDRYNVGSAYDWYDLRVYFGTRFQEDGRMSIHASDVDLKFMSRCNVD